MISINGKDYALPPAGWRMEERDGSMVLVEGNTGVVRPADPWPPATQPRPRLDGVAGAGDGPDQKLIARFL